MIHSLSDSFYKALTTFTYETLSESQKMVYDQVMKIISYLRGCDIFVRCLFNNMNTPKSSDVDVVKIIGKESFTTAFSRILCTNMEVHETKNVAISHGVQRVHRHHKTVLQHLECNHCVTNQRNLLVHKCEKHINKSTLDLPCRRECGKTLDNVHNYDQHEKACTETSRITCDECNTPFNTLGALQKHKPSHQKR